MNDNEQVITIEQLFREEREEIVSYTQELLFKLESMDLSDPGWSELKREIFKLEMVAEYLQDRLTGKIKGTYG